jgi:hypothetical protein
MFQTPALIVMTIAATRMYRSLSDHTDSGYCAFRFLRFVLMLTAADVAGLSIPIRLGIQITNRHSRYKFRSRCLWVGLARTIRLRIWTIIHPVEYRQRPGERNQER